MGYDNPSPTSLIGPGKERRSSLPGRSVVRCRSIYGSSLVVSNEADGPVRIGYFVPVFGFGDRRPSLAYTDSVLGTNFYSL